MKSFRTNWKAVIIFTLPAVAVFTIIVIYPLLRTLFMSFYEWDGILPGTFIFIENFKNLMKDEILYTSLFNGFIFAVIQTVFQLSLATFFALMMLKKDLFGKNFLRRSYFIPVVLSVTVVCTLWSSMYNPEFGLFNKIFEVLGLSYRQDWLSSMGKASIIAITITCSWQYMGYQLALIYAAAKSIPEHYFEAAIIDGATALQTHLKVTIPLMAETYKITLLFAFLGGLNAFGHMSIMTKGGPGTATYSLTYFMYRAAFKMDQYGYGCAIAVLLVIQCLLVTMLINRFVARENITY